MFVGCLQKYQNYFSFLFYSVATACMLVAGKVTCDTKINTRDAMNVSYSIIHPDAPPLDIGELSYSLKEGLIELELVVLRCLRFRLNFEHPHQDVILIIRLLRDWYPNIFLRQRDDIERVTAMLLQDMYVYPEIVLDHRPRTLAVAVISLAFSSLNLNIEDIEWAPVFMQKYDERRMYKIKKKILEQIYEIKNLL
uniref:Cyclin N-terminal domain-containing protein n=1 Tax=Meloidogyne incognita TaxID=6306 RepID=A0A914LER1_MELIC